MDLSNFIPTIAQWLGVAPATLVFLILVVNQLAKVGGRLIPNDATGGWAVLARLCAILGADPSSRLTKGVTVQDVATAALKTPPIPEKVAAAADGEEPKQTVDQLLAQPRPN